MDKQLFDEAIGEVPPSTFDVDGLVTRGRRAVRLRRVANPTVAAGAAVVLLTGAVAFTMSQDDGGSPHVGGQPTTSPATSTTESTPGTETAIPEPKAPQGCSRPDLESPNEVETRLAPVAKALVAALRPELHFSPNMTGGKREPFEFGQELTKQGTDRSVCDRFSSFVAATTTDGPEGTGNIVIVVAPAFFGKPSTCEEFLASHEPYCAEVTGPNGEVIIQHTAVQENGVTTKMVDMVRPDGTIVLLRAENVATSVKTGDDPTAAQTPLDHDQLVTIGIDPGLTLFP